MGKSKTKTTQTNSYGWQTPPTTPQQGQFDQWAQGSFNTPDPSIPYAFNNMRESVNNRLNNPFGADYSPEVNDAIRYNENQSINQMQGQAVREDAFNRNIARGQALQTSAGMHAPNLVATGSSGTTISQPSMMGLIGQGLSAGASLGSAAMM